MAGTGVDHHRCHRDIGPVIPHAVQPGLPREIVDSQRQGNVANGQSAFTSLWCSAVAQLLWISMRETLPGSPVPLCICTSTWSSEESTLKYGTHLFST